jgi:hypothetical protein
VRQGDTNLLKAVMSDRRRAISQRAQKLISSDPDERVIRAQVLLNCIGHLAQEGVARGMTVTVIDLLEAVDVDICEYEEPVCSAGTDDLAGSPVATTAASLSVST